MPESQGQRLNPPAYEMVGAKGFEPSTPASRTRIKQGGLYALDYWSERAVNRTSAMVGHAVYRIE